MANNKEKKVSVNQIDKIIKAYEKNNIDSCIYTIDDNDIIVEIKTQINIEEIMGFVNNAINIIFANNSYYPELREMAIYHSLLTYYTNIKTDFSLEKFYKFVTNTPIINDIKKKIYLEQFETLVNTVDRKVEYILNKNINNNEAINSIGEVVNTLNDLLVLAYNKLANLDTGVFSEVLDKISNIKENDIIKTIIDKNKDVISKQENQTEETEVVDK